MDIAPVTFATFLHLYVMTLRTVQGLGIPKDYCSIDVFAPSCNEDSVIMMQSAIFGLMKIGTCISDAHGNLGCQSNQIQFLDRQCSGLLTCEVSVGTSRDMKDSTPDCPKELTSYLEASYTCQEVYQPPAPQCTSTLALQVKGPPIYLASSVALKTNCGLTDAPILLQAEPGQKIKIELVDFGGSDSVFNNDCPRNYGHVVSSDSEDVIEICGGTRRVKQVHLSSANQVQIMINPTAAQDYKFLIKYEALGCPDLVPPRNAWLKKDDQGVTVGCHASSQTWDMKCVGKHWIGFMGNCSLAAVDAVETTEKTGFNTDHVLSVAIGSLALVMCCITVTIGVYCIKRHQYKSSYGDSGNYVIPVPYKGTPHSGNTIYTPYRTAGGEEGGAVGGTQALADLHNSVATGYSFQRPGGTQTLTAVQVHQPPLQAVQVHQRPLTATHVRQGSLGATHLRHGSTGGPQTLSHLRQGSTGGPLIATHVRQPSAGGGGTIIATHVRQPSTGGEAQRILALQAATNNNRSRTMNLSNNNPTPVSNVGSSNSSKQPSSRTLPPPLPQRPANQPPLNNHRDNNQSEALLQPTRSNTNTGPVTGGDAARRANNQQSALPPQATAAANIESAETSTLLSTNRPRGVHSPDQDEDEEVKYYVLEQPEPIYRTLEIHPTLNSDPED